MPRKGWKEILSKNEKRAKAVLDRRLGATKTKAMISITEMLWEGFKEELDLYHDKISRSEMLEQLITEFMAASINRPDED